jgi:hypothetical protein
MQASNPEGRLNRTFLASLTFAKTSITNPLFEVISLHGAMGPPKIKKRSKNRPNAHLRNIQQIQEYCDKEKSNMTRPRNRSIGFLRGLTMSSSNDSIASLCRPWIVL